MYTVGAVINNGEYGGFGLPRTDLATYGPGQPKVVTTGNAVVWACHVQIWLTLCTCGASSPVGAREGSRSCVRTCLRTTAAAHTQTDACTNAQAYTHARRHARTSAHLHTHRKPYPRAPHASGCPPARTACQCCAAGSRLGAGRRTGWCTGAR